MEQATRGTIGIGCGAGLGVHRPPSCKRVAEPAAELAVVGPLRFALVAAAPPERCRAQVLIDGVPTPLPAARPLGCRVGQVVLLDSARPVPRIIRPLDAAEALDAMRRGSLGADLYALHLRHAA